MKKSKLQSGKVIIFGGLLLLVVLSSFRQNSCWFGWCDSAPPVIVEAPGEGNGSGTNGYCVVYQPQEFRIFGIVFGTRNDENTVECQSAYQ
jgi:hypothetical protein